MAAHPLRVAKANLALKKGGSAVGKRGREEPEPSKLTVSEMIRLLFALAFLISTIYGASLVQPR